MTTGAYGSSSGAASELWDRLQAAEEATLQLRARSDLLLEALLWLCASSARLDLAQVVRDVTGMVLSLTGADVVAWAPGEETGMDLPPFTSEEKGLEMPPVVDDLPRLADVLWRGTTVQLDRDVAASGTTGTPVQAWAGVPVRARDGEILGALFVGGHQPGLFGTQEVELVQGLATYLGAKFETLTLFRERAHVAGALQQTLLPPPLPEIPGLEVAARYRPAKTVARVGGDFYDLFEVGEATWGFIVGDVSGVGPEAAALTGVARYGARAVASADHSPAELLQQLNDTLVRLRLREKFCTALYAHVRPGGRDTKVVMANGGHPYPFVLRASGKVEEVQVEGTLLGAFEQLSFPERELVLGPGDLMVCYTDGVTEARDPDGNFFGTQGLERALKASAGASAMEVARTVERAVLQHERGGARDDIAVIVIRNLDLPSGDHQDAGEQAEGSSERSQPHGSVPVFEREPGRVQEAKGA